MFCFFCFFYLWKNSQNKMFEILTRIFKNRKSSYLVCFCSPLYLDSPYLPLCLIWSPFFDSNWTRFNSTSAMSLLYECINTVIAVLISISTGMPGHTASIQVTTIRFTLNRFLKIHIWLLPFLFSSASKNCAFSSKIPTKTWNISVCWPCRRFWKLIPNLSRLIRISSCSVSMTKTNRFDCAHSTCSTEW